MTQIDKLYSAVRQGKTGYSVRVSDEVFDYLGAREAGYYSTYIDGADFILTCGSGPGVRFKNYYVRDNPEKLQAVTLPKIWADAVGLIPGQMIAKFKDQYSQSMAIGDATWPIIRIRIAVDNPTN